MLYVFNTNSIQLKLQCECVADGVVHVIIPDLCMFKPCSVIEGSSLDLIKLALALPPPTNNSLFFTIQKNITVLAEIKNSF